MLSGASESSAGPPINRRFRLVPLERAMLWSPSVRRSTVLKQERNHTQQGSEDHSTRDSGDRR